MPNELSALFNVMLELKKHKQTDEFLNIADKYGYSSKAKLMIALNGLDDVALSAIDELEKINGREKVQEQLSF